MLFGHRRDVMGYKNAIEQIDSYLPQILETLDEDDLLIITADHGCDPTVSGTDHTREQVPVLVYAKEQKGGQLPEITSFDYISKRVLEWLK